jgi:hypothetical protein
MDRHRQLEPAGQGDGRGARAAERGQPTPSDQDRSDVPDDPIDEVVRQERPGEGWPAFQEDRADPSIAEGGKQRVEIEAPFRRRQPHDLSQSFEMRRVSIVGDGDQRRGDVVEYPGGRRSSSVRVDNHPEWLAVDLGVADGRRRSLSA